MVDLVTSGELTGFPGAPFDDHVVSAAVVVAAVSRADRYP